MCRLFCRKFRGGSRWNTSKDSENSQHDNQNWPPCPAETHHCESVRRLRQTQLDSPRSRGFLPQQKKHADSRGQKTGPKQKSKRRKRKKESRTVTANRRGQREAASVPGAISESGATSVSGATVAVASRGVENGRLRKDAGERAKSRRPSTARLSTALCRTTPGSPKQSHSQEHASARSGTLA
jgi:hypothetical protein